MHPYAPTWSTGDPGLPTGELTQQDRANAAFAQEAPLPKGSKSKRLKPAASGRQLIKSLSTPQLRGPSTMSDSDKNRSRLGYQRTTIACAHCRRRKIRCVVSEDEPEQRCVNCIRLKRECVFYPVDQQTALDAQSESSTRTARVRSTASSSRVSSSPRQSSTRALGRPDQQPGSRQGSFVDPNASMTAVPIVPSTNFTEPAVLGATTSQRTQPGPGQFAPVPYPSQQGYDAQAWEPLGNPGAHPHQMHVPIENAMSMQHAYPAYTNPALQVDTAPFPGTADPSQPHPPYVDGGHYHHSSPMAVSQQWQQQQPHPQSIPQYHHQDVYHPSPQQEHLPPANFPLGSNPSFMTMAPSHSPQPNHYPHHPMQPQNPQFPAGYYTPTHQAPMQWHSGQPPPAFNNGAHHGPQIRRPGDYRGNE